MAALLTPGSMVASRWIVGGLLGQSERAQVYEAEEARQGRFAALKILAPALGEGPAWPEYVTLAKKLAELPGEGVARAYDIGIDSMIERPYIASERLVFPTLSRYVTERGAIPLRLLTQALDTLSAALDAAHGAGIVHGGLKPQNVFISVDNPRWARLTDFSLGRLRAETGAGPGSLLGWSAPEASAGHTTPASDRYSLALLCFFAATGSPWYNALRRTEGGDDSGRSSRLASERAKSYGGELDPAFDAWFERALAAEPEARFPSAREMAESFRRLFAGSLAPPPPVSVVHPFAATRPIPLGEQPTVPVKQVEPGALAAGASSPPVPRPSSAPAGT
ncbi:MAG TPA: serine/threonine-protein kinase, partial [Polyangiaceae bacterium]